MKLKKLVALGLVGVMALSIAACGGKDDGESGKEENKSTTPAKKEDVTLTLWGAEEDQDLLRQICDDFIAENKDLVNLTIEIGVESEATAKDTILTDVEAAADVFSFASDQINELVKAGALMEIPKEMGLQDVIDRNSGGSVAAATVDGKIYAYPRTADNGFFLFYNKEYFSEEDVKTWAGILAAAKTAGKSVTMQMNSGWYLEGFYRAVGLDASLADDGTTTNCNWNSTTNAPTGAQVTQAILDICKNDAFAVASDAEFATGVKEGTIIAGVNGIWNANTAAEAWGENYAACKLPTFAIDGKDYQMYTVAGSKLVGVNPYCENAGWALKLADFITNEKNQAKTFELRGLGPSNKNVAATDAVQANPAVAALAAQNQWATVQTVGNNFWSATETFGQILQTGNPDGTDVQTLLDNMVAGVTAPVA